MPDTPSTRRIASSREGDRTRTSATRAAKKARPNSASTILCGSSGRSGHRPAIDTVMNSPAKPSSIQARGHSRSNWSAHWLRRTFRSKALSSADG